MRGSAKSSTCVLMGPFSCPAPINLINPLASPCVGGARPTSGLWGNTGYTQHCCEPATLSKEWYT